ncbi:hypothetical protein [Telluria aromaticivorans]|uniref:Secretion system X translation initiation factor n=1 Tax=Telluria aromaticivorans TaxID=2725995 RepID=A0A7Y2K0F4_9BURK|nr:hypothetical protein [Telluria aromaticivorans]NNG23778.1 hypothetical protein [Telluria aromaticivorans]
MKRRHIAMGAALVLAAGLVVFGDRTPEDAVAEPVERAPATAAAAPVPEDAVPAAKAGAPAILRLVPRETLIGGGEDRFGASEGENTGDDRGAVFGRQDWTPPPPPPPPPEPAPPAPAPVAPPLPFTYIGKSLQDGTWEIYLVRGDRTHLVRENMVIDGTYRVDAIKPPVLTLTYLPLNQVQQLNIGVFD